MHGASWVNASDIRYTVATLEEGQEALRELELSSSPAEKRVWLRGCPWQGPTNAGEITPAQHNMDLCGQFFEIHPKIAVGLVDEKMMEAFVEQLDTFFVRDVAFSVNQDSKPPGPSTSGSFAACTKAYHELWHDFIVTEVTNLDFSAEGEEGDVLTVTQRAAMHLLYTGGMGHDDKVGQIIPGTEIVQESQSHTFKYVISPGDKSKLIYWKTEVDMSLIVAARKVAADLVAAERARIAAEEAARKKAEEERLAAEAEARRLEEEARMAAEAEAKRLAEEAAKAEAEAKADAEKKRKEEEKAAKQRAKEEAKKAKEAEAAAKKAAAAAAAAAPTASPPAKGKKK